jgi:hypothetical protein
MDLQLTSTALIPLLYSSPDIANESPTLSVKCGGNLPNLAEYIDMDSHCPEGAALFSALCFVLLLLTKYPRGHITGVVLKL